MPPFETSKMQLVSNFYDLPLQSWFFGQLEPIKRQLRNFEFDSSFILNNGSCVTSLGA